MTVGEEMLMTDLRRGVQIDVVVLDVRDDGKVLVETKHGPERRWLVGASFLAPRWSGRVETER